GVAVARRVGGGAGADHAARAGEVLDEEILPELLREVLCHQPRHYVGRPAGRVGDDHAHLPRRVAGGRALGMAPCGWHRCRQHQCKQAGGNVDGGSHPGCHGALSLSYRLIKMLGRAEGNVNHHAICVAKLCNQNDMAVFVTWANSWVPSELSIPKTGEPPFRGAPFFFLWPRVLPLAPPPGPPPP